jgi:hypothetical protein
LLRRGAKAARAHDSGEDFQFIEIKHKLHLCLL